MNNLRTGYYQADTANGVTFIGDILEDVEQDVTRPDIFANSLSDLSDNEIIVTFFDESSFDILSEIAQDYSIN